MGWLLLWIGIGLLNLAMLAGCGWMLWRKGRALWQELATQGRTVHELIGAFERLGLATDRPGSPVRNAPATPAPNPSTSRY